MHILEVYLESGGFDHRLIKGGISVYLWNLTRAFNARGHRTTVLSALNGQHDYLSQQHGLRAIDYRYDWSCSIAADPDIWSDRLAQPFALNTRAYHLRKGDTDFFYLGNTLLDLYPDTYYPPYEGKGTDPGFFKPLVFQMEAVRFIREWFRDEDLLIHAHEPFYQYLLPAAFADDPTKKIVSTVQSNMPITKKVYLPETRAALQQLGADPGKAIPANPLPATLFNRCLSEYLPRTHLNYPYPRDYVNLFDMVLADSDQIDFLSDGHRDFYTGFYGTAFRALFVQLDVAEQYRRHANKLFVGGCGLGGQWLSDSTSPVDRNAVLGKMGLDGALPTFFHSARYAPNHKGQVELILAIRQYLERGGRANFILRCITEAGVPDPRFAALARDFPDLVYFTSAMQTEDELRAMAKSSDFALFPSKFEMDTFLIAQGEAMASGCVPIASDQLGMQHWLHGRAAQNEADRTGFAVIRSFMEEDPALIASLVTAIEGAVTLHADAARFGVLSQRARNCARQFDWQSAGDKHLAAFALIGTKRVPAEPPRLKHSAATDWQGVAYDKGQIMDLRHSANAPVPELRLDGQQLCYRCLAAAVTAFCWTGSRFTEQAMTPLPDQSGFFAEGFASSDIILLVTLPNGDQFWDGLMTTGQLQV